MTFSPDCCLLGLGSRGRLGLPRPESHLRAELSKALGKQEMDAGSSWVLLLCECSESGGSTEVCLLLPLPQPGNTPTDFLSQVEMLYNELSPGAPRVGAGFAQRPLPRQLSCCSGASSFLVKNNGVGTQTYVFVLEGESCLRCQVRGKIPCGQLCLLQRPGDHCSGASGPTEHSPRREMGLFPLPLCGICTI